LFAGWWCKIAFSYWLVCAGLWPSVPSSLLYISVSRKGGVAICHSHWWTGYCSADINCPHENPQKGLCCFTFAALNIAIPGHPSHCCIYNASLIYFCHFQPEDGGSVFLQICVTASWHKKPEGKPQKCSIVRLHKYIISSSHDDDNDHL